MFYLSALSFCTEIKAVLISAVGDSIKVEFDLENTIAGQFYNIEFYSEINGEKNSQKLIHVNGDFENVYSGHFVAYWSLTKEYGTINGDLRLNVKAVPSKFVKTTKGELGDLEVTVNKVSRDESGKTILELEYLNNGGTGRFDIYTNMFEAKHNEGTTLADCYYNGIDKVNTSRPFMMKKGETMTIKVVFLDINSNYISELKLGTKYPSSSATIQNLFVQ